MEITTGQLRGLLTEAFLVGRATVSEGGYATAWREYMHDPIVHRQAQATVWALVTRGRRSRESAEQQARDMLARLGVEHAQSYTTGDLVELANLIADAQKPPALNVEEPEPMSDALFVSGMRTAVLIDSFGFDAPKRTGKP